MDDLEVPKYFMCPISLQIMRDPVTAMTGITYDRESIEKWLSMEVNDNNNLINDNNFTTTCPVTKQPLPRDSDLTPNLTLRRLIQAWCVAKGVDRIPTPKPPLDRRHVLKLVRELRVVHDKIRHDTGDDFERIMAMKKMEALAAESERNRKCMAEGGVVKAMASFVAKSFEDGTIFGVEEALRILHLVWASDDRAFRVSVDESGEFLESLSWVLGFKEKEDGVAIGLKFEALKVLRLVIKEADSRRLERLRLELFMNVMNVLRLMREYYYSSSLSSSSSSSSSSSLSVPKQAVKSALETLIEACPWGRNRMKIIEAGAVAELVELELGLAASGPDRHVTELGFALMAHLCSCADGRAQLVGHPGGIAVVAKRILRVSAATDEQALRVLSLVARFSARSEVVVEMLAVGAVAKLCMVMQADCDKHLKEKARGILRLHSKVWNESPCIAVYLMSRPPR